MDHMELMAEFPTKWKYTPNKNERYLNASQHAVSNGEVESMQIKLNVFEIELITHNTHGTWHTAQAESISGCGVFAHQIVVFMFIYTVDP